MRNQIPETNKAKSIYYDDVLVGKYFIKSFNVSNPPLVLEGMVWKEKEPIKDLFFASSKLSNKLDEKIKFEGMDQIQIYYGTDVYVKKFLYTTDNYFAFRAEYK